MNVLPSMWKTKATENNHNNNNFVKQQIDPGMIRREHKQNNKQAYISSVLASWNAMAQIDSVLNARQFAVQTFSPINNVIVIAANRMLSWSPSVP